MPITKGDKLKFMGQEVEVMRVSGEKATVKFPSGSTTTQTLAELEQGKPDQGPSGQESASDRLIRANPENYETHSADKELRKTGKVTDIGDDVAESFRDLSIDAIYDMVAQEVDIGVKELKTKYGHLNTGMQRMNLGNRLRGYRRQLAAREAAKSQSVAA